MSQKHHGGSAQGPPRIQWQRGHEDNSMRTNMIQQIANCLVSQRINPEEQWLRKVPEVAQRLEGYLYQRAASPEEYNDLSTLKTRLQQVAAEVSTAPRRPQANPPGPSSHPQPHPPGPSSHPQPHPPGPSSHPQPHPSGPASHSQSHPPGPSQPQLQHDRSQQHLPPKAPIHHPMPQQPMPRQTSRSSQPSQAPSSANAVSHAPRPGMQAPPPPPVSHHSPATVPGSLPPPPPQTSSQHQHHGYGPRPSHPPGPQQPAPPPPSHQHPNRHPPQPVPPYGQMQRPQQVPASYGQQPGSAHYPPGQYPPQQSSHGQSNNHHPYMQQPPSQAPSSQYPPSYRQSQPNSGTSSMPPPPPPPMELAERRFSTNSVGSFGIPEPDGGLSDRRYSEAFLLPDLSLPDLHDPVPQQHQQHQHQYPQRELPPWPSSHYEQQQHRGGGGGSFSPLPPFDSFSPMNGSASDTPLELSREFQFPPSSHQPHQQASMYQTHPGQHSKPPPAPNPSQGLPSYGSGGVPPQGHGPSQPMPGPPPPLDPSANKAAAQTSSGQQTLSRQQRDVILQQQQQRLLLLWHASKCDKPTGTCNVSRDCVKLKQLWLHMRECKNPECQVSHCVSMRFFMSHYHECRDANCDVCRPIRDATRRTPEHVVNQYLEHIKLMKTLQRQFETKRADLVRAREEQEQRRLEEVDATSKVRQLEDRVKASGHADSSSINTARMRWEHSKTTHQAAKLKVQSIEAELAAEEMKKKENVMREAKLKHDLRLVCGGESRANEMLKIAVGQHNAQSLRMQEMQQPGMTPHPPSSSSTSAIAPNQKPPPPPGPSHTQNVYPSHPSGQPAIPPPPPPPPIQQSSPHLAPSRPMQPPPPSAPAPLAVPAPPPPGKRSSSTGKRGQMQKHPSSSGTPPVLPQSNVPSPPPLQQAQQLPGVQKPYPPGMYPPQPGKPQQQTMQQSSPYPPHQAVPSVHPGQHQQPGSAAPTVVHSVQSNGGFVPPHILSTLPPAEQERIKRQQQHMQRLAQHQHQQQQQPPHHAATGPLPSPSNEPTRGSSIPIRPASGGPALPGPPPPNMNRIPSGMTAEQVQQMQKQQQQQYALQYQRQSSHPQGHGVPGGYSNTPPLVGPPPPPPPLQASPGMSYRVLPPHPHGPPTGPPGIQVKRVRNTLGFPPADPEKQRRVPELTKALVDNSFLVGLDRGNIQAHVESLFRYKKNAGSGNSALARNFDPTKNFKPIAHSMWKMLMEQPHAQIFKQKVDPEALGIPDYFDTIKHPMDLGTIRQRLDSKQHPYRSLSEFAADVRLTFQNAVDYNGIDSEVGSIALEYGRLFEKEYNMFREKEDESFELARYQDDCCRICAQKADFLLEPPTYYCEGNYCDGSKIKRDAVMYVNGDHRLCKQCYMNSESLVKIGSDKFPKASFKRKKNNEEFKEEWIVCYWCRRRCHAICAMAKTPIVTSDEYICPFCALRSLDDRKVDRASLVIAARAALNAQLMTLQQQQQQQQQQQASRTPGVGGTPTPLASPTGAPFPIRLQPITPQSLRPDPEPKRTAAELPETHLSRFLEERVKEFVKLGRQMESKELKCEERDLEAPGELTIRVVLSQSEELLTRDMMINLYGPAPHNFPKSFPYTQKCILLFENIDGLDVLLFVMFVQYYGSDAPAPNQRSLYIAYLDSVNYFTPGYLRTGVYHELIISLLEYEKKNGFTRCFIWACPPQGGDDYIFNVHPKEQRVPDSIKLRNWYFNLLETARRRRIVVSLNTLFDEYFARVPDVTHVPYFDGDWWQAYGEHFIKILKDKKTNPLALQSRADAMKNFGGIKCVRAVNERERQWRRTLTSRRTKSIPSGGGSDSILNTTSNLPLMNGEDSLVGEGEKPMEAILCPPPRLLEQVPLQDMLTARIAGENDRMKRDFIVVKMFEECAECGTHMDEPGLPHWVGPSYDPELDRHEYSIRCYAAPFCLCHPCYLKAYEKEFGKPLGEIEMPKFPPEEWQYQEAQAESQHHQTPLVVGPEIPLKVETPKLLVETKDEPEAKKLKVTVDEENSTAIEARGMEGVEDEHSTNNKEMGKNDGVVGSNTIEYGSEIITNGSNNANPSPTEENDHPHEDEDVDDHQEDEPDGDESSDLPPDVAAVVDEAHPHSGDDVMDDDGDEVEGDNETTPSPPPNPASTTPSAMQTTARPSSTTSGLLTRTKRRATDSNTMAEEFLDLDNAHENVDIEVLPPGVKARPPNPWARPPCSLTEMKLVQAMIRPRTIDPDPPMESAVFESRKQFLNVCQARKLQFDELRRAKHSTATLLHMLHNPDTEEGFVPTCNNCRAEVLGERYTCTSCDDFDLCRACFGKIPHIPGHVLQKQGGVMQPLGMLLSPSSSASQSSSQKQTAANNTPSASSATAMYPYSQQRLAMGYSPPGNVPPPPPSGSGTMHPQQAHAEMIRLQLSAFYHAWTCSDPNCAWDYCAKMKRLMEHSKQCSIKVSGGCSTCRKYWYLLSTHVKHCRSANCRVGHCNDLKARIRAQQNQSADRRVLALMRNAGGSEQQQQNREATPSTPASTAGGNGGTPGTGGGTPMGE